ncbi:MAG: hypothetical protein ACUVWV_01795 [Thermodesulfobacteriota bacterium]
MQRKNNFYFAKLALVILFLTLPDCASTPSNINRHPPGPQLVVNPEMIRLGVVTLRDTNIVFQGAGFKPGDSIFIVLHGPQDTKVIVAEASITSDGTFQAVVQPLTKIMEILKADVILDENFQNVVVISRPPIPEGIYKARVTSMFSKLTAETAITICGPNLLDRFKDWIGKITGKIQYK